MDRTEVGLMEGWAGGVGWMGVIEMVSVGLDVGRGAGGGNDVRTRE